MIVLPAFAQQSTKSVVFNENSLQTPTKEIENASRAPLGGIKAQGTANKTTANVPTWFDMGSILYSSATSKFYYNMVYQDSNLTYVGSSGPVHIFNHGLGMSFDPTDSSFFSDASAGQIQDYDYVPGFRVRNSNSYSVDSIAFSSKYYRNQADPTIVDSMIIYVAKVATAASTTNPPGLFDLQFTASQERFVTAWFDSSTSELSPLIPVSARQRIAIPLDQAFHADTATNGFSNITGNGIALPSVINCGPGEKILAYVMFKSATQHPLHTPATSANHMRMYSYDFRGLDLAPIQNKTSTHAGLVATSQIKYEEPGSDFTFEGRSVLIPSIAYATDGLMTDMAFRVTCAQCDPTGIKETASVINNTNVYPNPANGQVTITFNVKEATDVNVSITNTVGQVMKSQNAGKVAAGKAVFTTSDLASGVYFYTVEANGQRTTGRFVVAH